ncbi:hypothetical protein GIY56_06765 [Paracoccus sp. YIM 132242]|uniref:Uncharacterized protein n=1 Tax=Paracoccus lichenicola TaxID=2665644 RepID=A0A6L6HNK6_9RHOB|nr:hypothetical protein [Paracoccus lichenicola]MTD99981.1 hypothetical protein [Paracoccus lichenicola]
MTKPISDKSEDKGTSRLRAFTRQDREAGTHPAIEALRTRPQTRSGENRKAVEYARIERGQTS